MSKPFFYRLDAAEFLAAVVTIPEEKRADWVLRLALDLVSATHTNEFSQKLIDEARTFKDKKSKAGKRGAQNKWIEGGSNPSNRSERLARARSLGTHTKAEWEALKEITGYKCVRCGCSIQDDSPTKDHIVPIYLNGSDSIDNIQPVCKSCNSSKTGESVDFRPNNWRELLDDILANAQQMHSKRMAVPSKCITRNRSSNRNNNIKPSSSSLDMEIETTLPISAEEAQMTTKIGPFEFRVLYQQTFNKIMPPVLNHDVDEICRTFPKEIIENAFAITAEKGGNSFAYFKAVLNGTPKEDINWDQVFGETA